MNVSKYLDPDFLRKYEERVKIHWHNPYPQILQIMKHIMHHELKGKKVLDIGCGSGELTKKLADMEMLATGIDISHVWIKLCCERYPQTCPYFFQTVINPQFLLLDASDCSEMSRRLGHEAIDVVIMNMVLINVSTKKEVDNIFNAIRCILKKDGLLIFSDMHPICKMTESVFPRYQKYNEGFSYFKDGSRFISGIECENGEVIEFQNIHWRLETYTDLLAMKGLYIYDIIEPTYEKDVPEQLRNLKFPEYILFVCKKK